MVPSATPNPTTTAQSVRLRDRNDGRAQATSTRALANRRSHTIVVGETSSNSDFANPAPSCTEAMPMSTSRTGKRLVDIGPQPSGPHAPARPPPDSVAASPNSPSRRIFAPTRRIEGRVGVSLRRLAGCWVSSRRIFAPTRRSHLLGLVDRDLHLLGAGAHARLGHGGGDGRAVRAGAAGHGGVADVAVGARAVVGQL